MRSVVRGEQVGCDPGAGQCIALCLWLVRGLTLFSEGKGVTSTSEGIAKGSEGEQM